MLYFGLVLFCAVVVQSSSLPTVKTPLGKIVGTHSLSYSKRLYTEFLGIPYAKPPIGKLRFTEPQEILDPFIGILIANTTVECIQIIHFPEPEGGYLTGVEDCLYLNIYVPKENPTEGTSLDVVVHIHGGALNFGSSTCYAGPKYLMDRDVVFVAFNYRLGPLGFLSTEDDILPGNNGMKDQSMALKWIKHNIKYFGGNPNSITITGLSAGGASVHYHYLSPLSRGLFNRGISVSGTALGPWTLQESALAKTRTLAMSVGCYQEDSKKLVDCLRQRPATQIVENVRKFRPWLYNPFSPFGIVIEKNNKNAFITKHPYELISTGEINDLPWITSVTSEEGLYPAADFALKDHYLPELEKRWLELAPYVLDYDYTIDPQKKEEVSRKIKEYYLNGRAIANETFGELIQIVGDRHFVVPSEKAAKLQAKVNKSPVYYYYFSYVGEGNTFSIYWTNSNVRYGVTHGEDMIYVFTHPKNPSEKIHESDEKMKDILLDLWSTFAKTGTPLVDGVEWKAVTGGLETTLDYIHIKSPSEIFPEHSDELGHSKFWNSLPFTEDEKLTLLAKKDEL